jgi:4-pyridoxolactonase
VLPFELPEQTADQTIPGQLRQLGIDPGEITHVINSHYHFDHVGGNKFCTGAVTLAHQKELRASHQHQPFERLGYSDLSFDEVGPRYELLTGDTEIASVASMRRLAAPATEHDAELFFSHDAESFSEWQKAPAYYT